MHYVLMSFPPGYAGPAAHETLLRCGRVVGTEVRASEFLVTSTTVRSSRQGRPSPSPIVVPGVINRVAAAERAVVLGDDPAVLADHDAVGIGVNLDWTSDRAGGYRVLVVVEAHEAGLGDRCLHRVEAIVPMRNALCSYEFSTGLCRTCSA
jgi:hypothetical protein